MRNLGITDYAQWEALPEAMRLEWMAEEILRRRHLKLILANLDKRGDDGKGIELGAYIAV